MAKSMLYWLLLTGILVVVVVMADGSESSEINPPKLRSRGMIELQKVEESIADPPETSGGAEAKPPSVEADDDEKEVVAEAPESRKMGKHHSSEAAGGGVIIGGLVTVTFAAVYCYIRVTRKTNVEKQ